VLTVARVSDTAAEELVTLAANGAAAPSTVVAEVEEGALPALAPDGQDAGVVRIRLGALDPAAVARLCASMLGDPIGASADAPAAGRAAAGARASGGWPRLAVEIVRAAVARAGTRRPTADDVARLDGRDLATLLCASLERLPAPARQLVDALAVLGRSAAATEL